MVCGNGIDRGFPVKVTAVSSNGSFSCGYLVVCLSNFSSLVGSESARTWKY